MNRDYRIDGQRAGAVVSSRGRNRIAAIAAGFALATMLAGLLAPAKADGWGTERSKCKWYAAKYVANSNIVCIPIPVPICISRQASCGDVDASCDAQCGGMGAGHAEVWYSGGWHSNFSRWGVAVLGAGGRPSPNSYPDSSSSSSLLLDTTPIAFNEQDQSLTLSLLDGSLRATADSSFSVLRFSAWVGADSTDTTMTAEKTFWSASLSIRNGQVAYDGGFAPGDFQVSEGTDGVRVDLNRINWTIPFQPPNGQGSFDNVQFTFNVDTGYGSGHGPLPGACCFQDGHCEYLTSQDCLAGHGIPQATGTTCTPNPCSPVPTREVSWGRIKAAYR